MFNLVAPCKFIESIDPAVVLDYQKYWATLTPDISDPQEIFNRFIFAYASVHTTWQANVRMYRDLSASNAWIGDPKLLTQIIEDSGAGLHVRRTQFLSDFASKYWGAPQAFLKKDTENWGQYRDRVQNSILGLGLAKTTFAIELIYPFEADLLCLDTHLLQLFGLPKGTSTPRSDTYVMLEGLWVHSARSNNVPPVLARHIFWDKLKTKQNSSYWSHVFERPVPVVPELVQV